ncbi:hypothetical protein G4228_005457 [Cervus hanglu yarkandensis]|nr:hypothetical protein G4228_005457 [Cervus hanglu yarkandensis]
MEFPDLGAHCSEPSCKRLDFLPLKCDACSGIFCADHVAYAQHHCGSAYQKDIQVPVCPLCNVPVPVARGESPDRAVGEHIDRDCRSDPAQQKRKSEDEALQRALELSLAETKPQVPSSQEEEDLALAQALSASEAEYRQQQAQSRSLKPSNCNLC